MSGKPNKDIKPLTEEQISVIIGAMLGDGCIRMAKGAANACFTYASKHKDHVEFIFNYFKEFCNYNEVKFKASFIKSRNTTYSIYYFQTRNLPIFTKIYHKWYPNNAKTIPVDLQLNNLINLVWYLGDGSLTGGKLNDTSGGKGAIFFGTNCFRSIDLKNIILPQLKIYSPKMYIRKNTQPIISIPRVHVAKFLQHIGPCPVISYEYKWNVIDYKRKVYASGVHRSTPEEIEKFIKLYESGLECQEISRLCNCTRIKVQYQLKLAGIYKVNRFKLKMLTLIQLEEIKQLRTINTSWKIIEATFNVFRSTVYYHWRKNNIVEV